MLGVGIGKYQIKPLAIIVACLLTGQMVYAEDDSVKKKDENIDEQAVIDLSKVVVAANVTNIMGIEPGISKGEVGKGTINQAQMDIIQANNMASALDKIPGVSSAGSPRPGGQTINVWGMSESKYVPIMVDGALKTFDKYQQGTLYVDPDLIKEVDVSKGDFNPDSMSGAFGGSIQLKTKDATDFLKDNQNLGAYVKYGHHNNNDQNNYAAAVYGQTKNEVFDGLIYFTRTEAKDIETGSGETYRGSSYDQNSFLLKGNIHFSSESKLTLSYADTRYKGWMPFAAKSGNTITVTSDDDYEWKRRIFYRDQHDQTYNANFEYLPTDNPYINFKADASYSKTSQHDQKIQRQDGKNKPSYSLTTFGKENWTDYSNARVHLRNTSVIKTSWAEHSITLGAQYLRKEQKSLMFYDEGKYGKEEFNYGYFTPYFLPSGRQTVSSVYINDDIKIGYLTISPSLRYDYVKNQSFGNVPGYSSTDPRDGHDYRSVSYDGLTSKLGLYWQQSDAWALFADYSHSWRAPNIDEQYSMQGKGMTPSGTSRYLGKEKLNAFRVGGLVNLQNVLSEGDLLSLKATAFQNKVKNEVVLKRGAVLCESQHLNGESNGKNCPKPQGSYHNGPGYTIKGLELEAKYDSEYIFGGLAATVMKGKRKGSPRNIWMENGTWMRDIPPRELTATLGFNIPQYNFSMGWQSKMVRKQTRTPKTLDPKAGALSYALTPGYSVHNLFMVYQPFGEKDLKINFTIDNIFNKEYSPYLSDGIPSPGRDIRLSVSYQF